jgi:hypothetical protein
MKTSVKSLAFAAAFAGLIGGTSVRLHAQTAQQNGASAQATHAGILLIQDNPKPLPKHACKGKNDCKGQGGGKHPGKNDCKGKGGCATDGSKPPKAV